MCSLNYATIKQTNKDFVVFGLNIKGIANLEGVCKAMSLESNTKILTFSMLTR
jgi:hypothetical protein